MSIKNQDSVKEWIASVTTGPTNPQTGVVVLRNTLGDDAIFTRIEQGNFRLICPGAFKTGYTTMYIGTGDNQDQMTRITKGPVDEDNIQIGTWFEGVVDDYILKETTVEVRVYNQYNQ